MFVEDPSFLIKCHSDQIATDCNCTKVEVQTNQTATETSYPLTLGEYELSDTSFNGHPYFYQKYPGTPDIISYLFYDKKGKLKTF